MAPNSSYVSTYYFMIFQQYDKKIYFSLFIDRKKKEKKTNSKILVFFSRTFFLPKKQKLV